MRLITTIALALLGVTTWAQTSLPDLPTGAQRYSQTLWIVPSDSTLWTGATGNYAQVATREQLRQLAAQGYTKSQVDSAITSQIGLIDFPVTSVAGKTGDVGLEASDVGLGNVDNTTDLDKPISTATQGALDGKENAFSKGSLVAGTGVTLDGTLANRLVGSGNVTINSTSSLTASNGLQINSGVISPVYGTTAGTVAQGNDSRINNGQTAFNSLGNFWDIVSSPIYNQLTNLDDALPGRYELNTMASNRPYGFSSTVTIRQYSSGVDDLLQINWPFRNSGNLAIRNKDNSGNWTAWRSYWHDGNFTPPVAFTRTVSGLVPSPGGSGTTRYLREDGSWVDPSTGGGGGTATDLSIVNRNANTLQIGSSTGTNATVPAATTSLSGLMTASDKTKLNAALTDETDPTVPAHVKAITSGQISNWNTAFGWGDYRQYGLGTAGTTITSLEDFNDISRPSSFIRSASVANSPFSGTGVAMHINYGVDRSYQLWMSSVGGGALQFRHGLDGSWGLVRTVWHDGNFTPSNYLLTSNFTWANLSGKPSTFTPSPHSHSAADINSGTLAAARIGNATVSNAKLANMSANTIKGRSGSTGAPQDLTAAQVRTILNVADGATANATNAQLRNRATHTGTQAISTVSGLQSELDGKLSTSGGDVTRTVPGWPNSINDNSNNFVNTRIQSMVSNNSGLHFFGDGDNNARRFGIQVSHSSASFASSTGILELNPFGGNVYINGGLAAVSGTGSTQVRTNTQLDARYVQSIGAGSGISVSGTTVSVDGTVVRTTGNQSISGNKTFNSPTVAPQYQSTSTTITGTSIATNTHSLFKASISANTSYTLTNMSGNPRHIQVMVTNTSSSDIGVYFFNANMSTTSQNPTVSGNSTVIFTFLVENGTAWGTKTTF